MKKKFFGLLFMALLLTGCQMLPQSNTEDAGTEPANPIASTEVTTIPSESESATEPIVYEQQAMIAVSLPKIEECTTSEGNTTIFSHGYQSIQLVVQDPDVADQIIIDYLNRIDESHDTANALALDAASQYSGSEDWIPHFHNTYYSPTRLDQTVLSLYGITTTYAGGRPIQICSAANYNMLTGEVLTLGSILSHIDSKENLVDLVINQAELIAEDLQLFDDYVSCIQERFSCEESFDEDWYFTSNGIAFYFAPYDLAPYSSGIITIEVPYSKLTGIVADAFFPPEEDLMEGIVKGQRFADADLSSFTQIAEVILNPEGEMFFLSADGSVRDIRIDAGTWDDTGVNFTPLCTVFAASTLTPGDAIMVQTLVPDTLPNLRICYRSGYDIKYVYLSQSGVDGTVLLSEY